MGFWKCRISPNVTSCVYDDGSRQEIVEWARIVSQLSRIFSHTKCLEAIIRAKHRGFPSVTGSSLHLSLQYWQLQRFFFQIFSHEYIVSSIYLIRSLNFQINEEIKFKMMKPFDKNGIVVCGYGYTQCNLSLVHMQSLSFSKLTKMSTMCFVLSVT